MRKVFPIVVLAVGMAAGVALAQTTPDDLATALVNHGMDSNSAGVAALGIEAAISNSAATLGRITRLEGHRVTPSGYVIRAQAAYPSGSSVAPTVVQSTGADNGLKLTVTSGASYDYLVSVPADGTYLLQVRISAPSASTAPILFHFELSGQANATGSYTPADNSWQVVAAGTTPLTAGPQIVRIVVDQIPVGAALNWISLVQQ